MAWFGSNKEELHSNWEELTSYEKFTDGLSSEQRPVAVLKHSTRCGVSRMVKSGLERSWNIDQKDIRFFYLDLLQYRAISDQLTSLSGVRHESPQVLVFKNGKLIHDASHSAISVDAIRAAIS